MKAISGFAVAMCLATIASAQTVYVPSGTGGIGSSGNANVGIGTATPNDQLEIVTGNRRVGFNTAIAGITPGGILSLSRPFDGAKTLLLGATAEGAFRDNVVYSQTGNSELRFVSGGLMSAGFGFYTNMDATTAFGSARPTPVVKIDDIGRLGLGVTPTTKLDVKGFGGTSIDVKINGRIVSGDVNNQGGMWLNSALTMFVGANGATNMGLHNGDWRLIVNNLGNVGVGTTTPSTRFHVVGTGGASSDLKVNGRIVSGDANNQGGMWMNSGQTMFVGAYGADKVGIFNNSAWRMFVDANGNVGIGTDVPDAKLAVKGTVHAKEVKIDLNGAMGPDYVFEKNYSLPSLEEIKAYIDRNHHLPEVPSAKEMETEGIKVGEMNLLLLKKIEELTLYVIEQQRQIDYLKSKIEK